MTLEELEEQLDKWGNFVVEINTKNSSRKWKSLPVDFEVGAVAVLFKSNKWRFAKHNIQSRIAASKAQTFEELIAAINKAQAEDNNRK